MCICLAKWTNDEKQGFGYTLSNDSAGVNLPDDEKIIKFTGSRYVYCIHKNATALIKYDIYDEAQSLLTLSKTKKIRVFRKYLAKKPIASLISQKTNTTKSQNPVYVKRWRKFKQGFMFLLSNRVVQTYFKDKSEIIIDQINNSVHYIGPKTEQEQEARLLVSQTLIEAKKSTESEFITRFQLIKKWLTGGPRTPKA